VRVNVSAGVFSALRMSLSDVCVSDCFFDGVRTADNGVVLGHARAVAANCAALTVQNSVVANVTARGSVDAVIAFIAVLSPCSFAGGVASASSSATLVGVVIADNAVVQVQGSARRRDLVRFDVKADVQLRNTVARNNSAFGALLRSDCRRFVADQFVSSGNAMVDAADFATGVTSESVTIRSSRIETIGAVGAMAFACVARRTDTSAFAVALENATVLSSGSPGVISVACDGGGDSFLIDSSTLVNTLLLTKATFAGSGGFRVGNTTFDRSTLHFVVSPLATAWRHAATYGLLPIAGLVVAAIPSALLWLRRAHGGRLPDTHPVFGVLYECYRTERARLWWEAFVLARRAAVGLVVVFAENPLRRAIFTSINAVGLLATAHVRPFASETENALDATAALFLAVLGATSGIDATALGWTGSVVVSSITAIPVVLIARR
jgi:hypothetical protein